MSIKHQITQGVCFVKIYGNIALDGVDELREYLVPFLKDETLEGIALNLESVEFIDSSGVGLVTFINNSLKNRETKLVLYQVNDKILEIFYMTGLNQVLVFCANESEVWEILREEPLDADSRK